MSSFLVWSAEVAVVELRSVGEPFELSPSTGFETGLDGVPASDADVGGGVVGPSGFAGEQPHEADMARRKRKVFILRE
jgi:hypothetical protein